MVSLNISTKSILIDDEYIEVYRPPSTYNWYLIFNDLIKLSFMNYDSYLMVKEFLSWIYEPLWLYNPYIKY